MRRFVSLFTCTALLLGTVQAFAATGINTLSVTQTGGTVQIEGSVTEPVVNIVQYSVLSPDHTAISESTYPNAVVLAGQNSIDDDGTFSFAIMLGSSYASGDYTVVLNTFKGGTAMSKTFSYVSDSARLEILKTLNSKSSTDIYSTLCDEASSKLIQSFGIDLTQFNSLTEADKSTVARLIANFFATDGTYAISTFGKAFNQTVAYTRIMSASSEDAFELLMSNAKLFDIDTTDVVYDELIVKAVKASSSSSKLAGFISAYNDARAVSALNNTVSYLDVNGILTKFSDIFGINLKTYNTLSSSAKAKVDKAMIGTYETPTEVKKKFDSAVASASSTKKETSSSGGGGGGGGGSGSQTVGFNTVTTGSNTDLTASTIDTLKTYLLDAFKLTDKEAVLEWLNRLISKN